MKTLRFALALAVILSITFPVRAAQSAAEKLVAEADALRNQATQDARAQAIEKYIEALALLRSTGERKSEAAVLRRLGDTLSAAGDQKKAIEFFIQELAIRRELADSDGEANALNNIGLCYRAAQDYKKAIDYFTRALDLFRATGNRRDATVALNNIGISYRSMGERDRALEYHTEALSISRQIGDRSREAVALNNLAATYDSMEDRPRAIEFYNQALIIYRDLKDQRREAVSLAQIGEMHRHLGDNQKALDYYDLALPVFRQLNDRRSIAAVTNNKALVYRVWGEMQKALDLYNESLALDRELGDRRAAAQILNNMGLAYYYIGDVAKAVELYEQALPVFREFKDERREAYALNNIGLAFEGMNQPERALTFFNQAIEIRLRIQDRTGLAATLGNVGEAHRRLGQTEKALDYYSQAVAMCREIGDPRLEALTLISIGKTHHSLKEYQKAIDYFNTALPLTRATGDRSAEADAIYGLARAEAELGKISEAREHIETSLSMIESLRAQVLSQELRARYFASVQNYHRFYIELLMRLHEQNAGEGFDAHAIEASERARAKSLIELLTEARADIRRGVDSALLEKERALQRELVAKGERQILLLTARRKTTEAAAVEKEIESLKIELQKVEAQIRAASPRYASLTQPQPVTITDIQKRVLDRDTVLLEYWLGDERSFLWAVTTDSVNSFVLPARAEIEKTARRFHELLSAIPVKSKEKKRDSDKEKKTDKKASDGINPELAQTADALSRMLIAPAASLLANKRLLIVADGALNYVPFAALPDPETRRSDDSRRVAASTWLPVDMVPLIVNHEIVNAPSATTIALQRQETAGRKPVSKLIAVIADPVFNVRDERVAPGQEKSDKEKESSGERGLVVTKANIAATASDLGMLREETTFARLKSTRKEAEEILAYAEGPVLHAVDFNASRETALGSELGQYRYIHIATHGFFNTRKPELSGIVLSRFDERGGARNGFLLTPEIYNLNLPVEMVVLSACQTGLGEEVKGEGIVGLTRGFMYAGAARVVVSLWSVADRPTADLMVRFYKGVLKKGIPPAAALRAAQIRMWKKGKWDLPYYWAGFVIQGEWR
ncbi:MAG: tetratricopeptide repeat protein [Acidobacteriota bacterium]